MDKASLKKIIKMKLIEVVRREVPIITYGNLKKECGIKIPLPMLTDILDEINIEERKSHRPLLSAVVVNKIDNLPGRKFFDKAKENGWYDKSYFDFSDFYLKQMGALIECWKTNSHDY